MIYGLRLKPADIQLLALIKEGKSVPEISRVLFGKADNRQRTLTTMRILRLTEKIRKDLSYKGFKIGPPRTIHPKPSRRKPLRKSLQ